MSATELASSRIEELESSRIDAMRSSNAQRLSELFDEDCVYIHGNASVDTGNSYLQKIENRTYIYDEIVVHDRSISTTEYVAIVQYRFSAQVIASGVSAATHSRGMAVWTRRQDDWRLLAFQATPLANDQRNNHDR